jgi:hypothetical protein
VIGDSWGLKRMKRLVHNRLVGLLYDEIRSKALKKHQMMPHG